MKTVWTNGLKGDAKDDIVSSFKHSILLRGRLQAILEDKIEIKRKARRKEEGYESPSWAFQQADSVGYERALAEVISLIVDDSK